MNYIKVASVCVLLVLFSCAPKEIMVDFDPEIEDYTPIIREIIEANSGGDMEIVFSEGEFNFYPENAFENYIAISNNDNGDKRIVFQLNGMNDVAIKGDKSVFMMHGSLIPFHLFNSNNVSISGISIDYDYPFVFEGKVIARDAQKGSFVVEAHKDNDFEIRGDTLYFKGYDWESTMGENIVFNPETRSPYYSTELYDHPYHQGLMKARLVADNKIEFSECKAREMPPIGSIYTDKGPHGKNRRYPAFSIQNSTNVNLNDLNVYCSGAMALIAEMSKNISLDSFNVFVREGSDRMISASADATHFINCSGDVIMENCRFESMLDDATNIHGTYMVVDSIVNNRTFNSSFGHFQQEGFAFAKSGDTLLFVDRVNLMSIGEGVVESVEVRGENDYFITTSFDLTLINGREVAVDNASHYAAATIRNCSVKYNRARSLLISTKGDVLIEDCNFASMMAGIRICGDANFWFESGRTNSVIVRGNTFTDLGVGGFSPQAILQIDPVIPKDERGCGYYHQKIVFEDNTVVTFDSQVIYALSVDSLIIRNNRFVDSKSYQPRYPNLSVIDAQYCNNLVVEGNNFSDWRSDATISVIECSNKLIDEKRLKITKNPNKFFYEN